MKNLLVVETDDDIYLGTVIDENRGTPEHMVVISNGLRGRPIRVPAETVQSIVRADLHPDVEFA